VPFTPLHLGPGAVFKAIGGRHFSFMVFGGAQVLMDLQPLAAMLGADVELHGASHTLAGALAIGAIAALIGRPISLFVLQRSKIPHRPFSWGASAAGAFVGTFSHVGLDALMHPDVHPLSPFAAGNPLYDLVGYGPLHVGCVVQGVVGGALVWWRLKRAAGRN
jgi:hypothetical protein